MIAIDDSNNIAFDAQDLICSSGPDSQQQQILTNLLKRVAQYLPGEWTTQFNNVGQFIEMNSDNNMVLRCRLYQDRGKPRLRFEGSLPTRKEVGYFPPPPRITVSAIKSPLSIANHILRRLVPTYINCFQEALTHVTEIDREHTQRLNLYTKMREKLRPNWSDSSIGCELSSRQSSCRQGSALRSCHCHQSH